VAVAEGRQANPHAAKDRLDRGNGLESQPRALPDQPQAGGLLHPEAGTQISEAKIQIKNCNNSPYILE